MSSQLNRKCCLAVVVALLMPQPPALAQSVPPECPTDTYKLTFSPERKIDTLKAKDMLVNEVGTAINQQQLLAPPPINSVIIRDLPQLWRMRVPSSDVSSLKAKYYDATNINDKRNPFKKVNLVPLEIKQTSCPSENNEVVVEGGVQIQFTNFWLRGNTGFHTGAISVCVSKESTECP